MLRSEGVQVEPPEVAADGELPERNERDLNDDENALMGPNENNNEQDGDSDDEDDSDSDDEDDSDSDSDSELSDDEDHPITEEHIPPILGKDDSRRMKLTAEEHQWALDLKDAVEMMPDLDNLSDFWYAQLAVITRGNINDAVNRAYGIQDFRREYKILNSYEEGCKYLRFLIRQFPKVFLSFGFSELEGTYVMAQDASEFDTSVLTSPVMVDSWISSIYYMELTFGPDLATIRNGHIILVECARVGWDRKPDFKLMQRVFAQLLAFYPMTHQVRQYHTGLVFSVLFSIVKRFLHKDLRDRIKMGLQYERRLDELYLVPDVATANQRIIVRLEEALRRRLDNEESFTLSRRNVGVN